MSFNAAQTRTGRPLQNNVMNQNGSYALPTVPLVYPPNYDARSQNPPTHPIMTLPEQSLVVNHQASNYMNPGLPYMRQSMQQGAAQNFAPHMPMLPPGNYMAYQQQPYYMQQMPGNMPPMPAAQQNPQMNMAPVSEPPQPRPKKLLLIVDPATNQAIDIKGQDKDSNSAVPPPEKLSAAPDVRQEFSKIMLTTNASTNIGAALRETVMAAMAEKETEPGLTNKEERATVAEVKVDTTPFKPTSEQVEAAPSTKPQETPAAVTAKKDEKSTELKQSEKQHTQHLESLTTSSDKDKVIESVDAVVVSPTATFEAEPDVLPALVGATMSTSMLAETVEEEEEENDGDKSEEERAAEEAEKRSIREAELAETIEAIEKEQKEQIDQNVYSREFLEAVRTIEKEFKWTTCPLTEEQLKGLGIDKSTAPAREATKPSTFAPKWMKSEKPRQYSGRGSMDSSMRGNVTRGQHVRKPTVARPSIERTIERAVPLRKSENAWKPDKKLDGLTEEEVERKKILKSVRALMNKVTPTTQKELTDELLNFEVSKDREVLKSVIEIIFDKAVEEPKFCPLYAEMCKAQVDLELKKKEKEKSNQSHFRDAILTRAQKTFETNKAEDDGHIEKVKAWENETDEQKKAELYLALQEYDAKIRRRRFGNITFIGQLYTQHLLSYKVVASCLMRLFGKANGDLSSPEIEESIDCAIRLMASTGQKLEFESKKTEEMKQQQQSQQQKLQSKPQSQSKTGRPGDSRPVQQQAAPQPSITFASFDQFMAHADELKKKAPPRIKYMIMDLQELRNNKWQKRKTGDQGPKKLDELHQEIKQEQYQNQQARDKYEKERGNTGSSYRGSEPKKVSIVPRGSLNSNKTNPNDRRKAAATTSSMTGGAPPKKLLSQVSNTNTSLGHSKWGQRGASGGATHDNERKTSGIRGAAGSREASEARTSSVDDERTRAVESVRAFTHEETEKTQQLSVPSTPMDSAARDETPSPTLVRSISQASMDSQGDVTLSDGELAFIKKMSSYIFTELAEKDLELADAPRELIKLVNENNLSIRTLFKLLAAYFVRSAKDPDLKANGHFLAFFLQSAELNSETKGSNQEALRGIADYCQFAISSQEYCDHPKMWERLAEVLVNAIQCDLADFQGKRPQLEDFADTFKEAAKDSRKPFELLVFALKRMAEINYQRDPGQHDSMTAMAYDEVKFIKDLPADQAEKLNEALKEIDIFGQGNLYALLTGSSA